MQKHFALACLFVAEAAFAQGPSVVITNQPSPKPPVILKGHGQRAEVQLHGTHQGVDVYMNNTSKDLPPSVVLSLVGPDGRHRDVELKALNNQQDRVQYHGELSPFQQSAMGFELKIPFEKSPPVILRSPQDQDGQDGQAGQE